MKLHRINHFNMFFLIAQLAGSPWRDKRRLNRFGNKHRHTPFGVYVMFEGFQEIVQFGILDLSVHQMLIRTLSYSRLRKELQIPLGRTSGWA